MEVINEFQSIELENDALETTSLVLSEMLLVLAAIEACERHPLKPTDQPSDTRFKRWRKQDPTHSRGMLYSFTPCAINASHTAFVVASSLGKPKSFMKFRQPVNAFRKLKLSSMAWYSLTMYSGKP